MYAHAATILLSAFLLFMVQPLIGRYILPRYGGAPGVWMVALLFFQFALMAGYAYAHVLTRVFRPKLQAIVHGLTVLGGVLLLPVIPPESASGRAPLFEILWLLVSTIGLPFVVLASTSPLLQAWLGEKSRTPGVYRLYALSNVGSLVALLAYPFALEPWVGLNAQAWSWSVGYGVFVAATLIVILQRVRAPLQTAAAEAVEAPPSYARRALWVALPAAAVWMLMAVTGRMTLNIAPVPFLWVLPLGMYLLSFVVTFSGERWYRRRGMLPAFIAAVVVFGMAASGTVQMHALVRVVLYVSALLVTCLVLHGELYRLRPVASRLTGFYLCVAAGGALGGMLVGVGAPSFIPMFWEYEIGQVLCVLAVLWALSVDSTSIVRRFRPRVLWVGIVLLVLLWLDVHSMHMRRDFALTTDVRRSFFGVTRVIEEDGVRTMVHGTTNHGTQFLDERGAQPTAYFGPASGVGKVLRQNDSPRRIGIVGLGAGTMAVYGREGDVYRFYELDPEVEQLARKHFSYLRDSQAEIEVVIGDGRLLLRDEGDQRFDVLILDAFSSGAVPVHLLTLEAFEIYRRHLADSAVVCVNITNHNLDLRPILAAVADANDWQWTVVDDMGDESAGTLFSRWVILSADLRIHGFEPEATEYDHPPWTDDFSNLFRILK